VRAPSQIAARLGLKRRLRFASASNKIAPGASFGSTTAAQTHILSRHPFVIGSTDWAELVLCIANWRLQANSAFGVVTNPNPFNVVAISIEIGSTCRPVSFGGARATVVPAGAGDFLSDPVPAAAFGLSSFARGTTGFLRVWCSVDVGSTYGFPNIGVPGGTHTIKCRRFDPTKTQVNNIDGTGELSYTMINGGANGVDAVDNQQAYCPMILGRPMAGDAVAVVFIGDSKTAGVGDVSTVLNLGGLARALIPASGAADPAGATAGCNMGCSGGIAADWGIGSFWLLDGLLKYATHAIEAYGTNGLSSSASLAIHPRLRTAGIRKIIRYSLTPKVNHPPSLSITSLTSAGTTATATVSSTANLTSGQSYPISGATPAGYNVTAAITVVDSTTFTYTVASGLATPATGTPILNDQYRTEALQTAVTSWGFGGLADTFENTMEALPASDADITYYDPAAIRGLADGGDYWKWRVNGTANYMTADGLHETTAGYEANVGGTGNIITAAGSSTGSLRSLIQALG